MEKKKISIIIPVYNVESYLEECLGSIINQSYRNIEIIIINDGSTDNSLTIINKYLEIDRRIIFVNQTNKGLSEARNVGLKQATGEYVLFIDSDDYISLDTCETINTEIIDEEYAVIVFERYRFTGTAKYYDQVSIDRDYFESGEKYIEHAVNGNCFTASACNKAFKKSFLDKYSLHFESGILHEDLFFVFKALSYADSVKVIKYPLYYYRWVRSGSIVNTLKDKDKDVLITIKLIEDFLITNKKEHILKSHFLKELIYTWICNAVVFKYPQKYLFSKKANGIVKHVLYSDEFRKYVEYFAYSKSVKLKWKITAWLSLNAYPVFVLLINMYGKLRRVF